MTTTTLLEVRNLPVLNTDAIATEAAAWVDSRLEGLTDAEEVAKQAARIVLSEDRAAEKERIKRDAAAYTLETGYRLRRGANLAGAMGVQRSRLMVIRRKMKEQADAGRFKPVPDAEKVLPRLAKKAAEHNARVAAARVRRDAAVDQLVAAGWKGARIAEIVGTDPSRVSHIKHKVAEVA